MNLPVAIQGWASLSLRTGERFTFRYLGGYVALWNTRRVTVFSLGLAALLAGAPAWAVAPKTPGGLNDKAFFKPELYITSESLSLSDVKDRLPNRTAWNADSYSLAAA